MITLFIGLALISIGVSATLIISKVRENALAAKKTKAVTDYVAPNQEEIDELETALGVGRDIVGLKDCHWVIMRGCEVTRYGVQVGDPDELKIYLRDAHNKSLRSASVSSLHTLSAVPPSRFRPSYVRRTADEMDALVQKGMKTLVKEEIESRQRESQLNNIIEKYNRKSVE